jgi:hypothetical protein
MTMIPMTLKGHVDSEGRLQMDLPTLPELRDSEVDIIIVKRTPSTDEPVDANGWPIGFFDRTFGALADDPIERPEQLPLEVRDEIE